MEDVTVSVPPGREFHSVLRLVLGGIGSRCSLTYEQVDELQLAVQALLDRREAAGDVVELHAAIGDAALHLELGPFRPEEDGAASRLLASLVTSVGTVRRNGEEWVELGVEPNLPEDGTGG